MNFSFKKHNICIGILFFVFNLVNGIEKKNQERHIIKYTVYLTNG